MGERLGDAGACQGMIYYLTMVDFKVGKESIKDWRKTLTLSDTEILCFLCTCSISSARIHLDFCEYFM